MVALLGLFGAATAGAQNPWTVTIRQTWNPLPIGTCHTVSLTVFDPATKGNARNASGGYVSAADFDMAVESEGTPAAVGKSEGRGFWSVCACQSATVGQRGTITATYPGKSISEGSRVPGVAFTSQVPFTFSAPESKYNAAGCDALKAAAPQVAVALPPSVPPVTLAPSPSGTPASPPAAVALPPNLAPVTLAPAPASPPGPTAPIVARPGALNAPSAPGPQNVRVSYGWPLVQQLAWDPVPGVTGYNVFSKMSAAVSQWTLSNPAPLGSATFADSNFRQPGTMYRVTALYSDGRQGSTDFVYTDPPRLWVPDGLSAEQISSGAVRLSWNAAPIWARICIPLTCPPPYIAGYLPSRVMGPGQPADGTLVPLQPSPGGIYQQRFEISNLPDGTHTWQVTADYGGIYETAGLPSASITLKAPPPPAPEPKFRVSILGFKAIVETNDDLLSRDGKNNEVYAAAKVCAGPIGYNDDWDPKYPNRTLFWHYTAPTCNLVRSATHGDVNGFPGRVKAGSGSASGGITSGDMIGAGPSGTTSGSGSTFPFLLWEGTLLSGKDAVWISPSLWEFGGVDLELQEWYDKAGPSDFGNQTSAAWQTMGGGFVPMNTSIDQCGVDRGNDRPIGLAPNRYPNAPPGLPCLLIGLTRAKAEAVLGGTPQEAGNPVGVLTMDLLDALSGHYVMYLKLERLP